MSAFTHSFAHARRLLRAVLHFPDRLLHDGRRAAVRRRIPELGRVERILVVCSGNICRSPYLAAVLRRKLPRARIASAGFIGFNRPVADHSLKLASSRGIDLSTFRSHLLDPRRARTADLVIVMESRQASYLAAYYGVSRARIVVAGDLDPLPARTRSIEDPWQQPAEVFASSFDRLERCADALCEILQPAGIPATAGATQLDDHAREANAGSTDPLPQPVL